MIEYLSIDLETKSGTDLSKSGVYRYTEDPEFEILLFGYSVNGGEVSVIDVACGEQIPEDVLRAIVDDSVTKWAFNAAFERICLSAWLRKNRPDLFCSYSIPEDSVGNYLNPASWKCSLIWSASSTRYSQRSLLNIRMMITCPEARLWNAQSATQPAIFKCRSMK